MCLDGQLGRKYQKLESLTSVGFWPQTPAGGISERAPGQERVKNRPLSRLAYVDSGGTCFSPLYPLFLLPPLFLREGGRLTFSKPG